MPPKPVPVIAVKKAFDLLSLLAFEDPKRQGMALKDLAEKLAMPPNTARNILKTMLLCGYATQIAGRKYVIGPNCRRIGASNYVDSDVFKNRLSKVLSTYTAVIHEALVFTVLIDGKRQVIARSEPENQLIRIDSRMLDLNIPIYHVPTGRVMVANADNREYRDILKHNGDIFDKWATYEKDIQAIRKAGYCEYNQDKQLRACAVAFRTGAGTLAAIGCHAPFYRCGNAKLQEILDVLHQAADELASKFRNVE